MSTFTTSIQHHYEAPNCCNNARKSKGIKTTKEEIKVSLLTEDNVYTENLRKSTKQLLEPRNKFSKVTGYKVNINTKSIVPAANNCTTSRQMENKNLRIPFTVTLQPQTPRN